MKKLLLFFLLPLYAAQPSGGIIVSGESLYLKPSTDNLAFAVQENQQVVNKPEEEWGYSASVGYLENDGSSALLTTWSRLTAHNETTAEEITSRVEFDWRNLDLDLHMRLLDDRCPIILRLIGGLRYTRVEFLRRISDGLYETSKSWGVGPHGGFFAKLCVGCGVGVFASLDTALLIGTSRAEQNEIQGTKNCQLFPTVGFRAGADYTVPVGNGSMLRTATGYQAMRIFSAIERFDRANHLQETVSPLDLTGFFITVELRV